MDNFYIDVHVDDKNDKLLCWYRDDQQALKVHEEPLTNHLYCFVPDNTGESEFKDIYGTPLKRINFDTRSELNAFSKRHDDCCFSDTSPDYKFMLTAFDNCSVDQPINIALYDIEVDFDLSSGTGYPSIDNPFGEINSIQFFDLAKQKYYILIPDHLEGKIQLNDEENPVKIVYTYSESDMLEVFAELIENVDIISGWNSSGFDLPYLIERAKLKFGERKGLQMFCRNGYQAKRREYVNDFGQDVFSYKLIGRHEVDMLQLYKKFNPGERPSFSLDSIVEYELGENKIDYDGDLGELYRANPQKFYEYALHDARLLKKLEDKLKIVQLAVTMSRMCGVKVADVTGAVKTNEGALAKFCLKENTILPDRTSNESEKYPGAVVYDTVQGRHTNIMTIDLNSLYPSVMKTIGCSKENMIIECFGGFDDYVAIISKSDEIISAQLIQTGEKFEIPAFELERIIRSEGYCIAANGVIFDGSSGILARTVINFLDLRKDARIKKAECEKAGDKNGADRYEMMQLVFKISANSLYGASGNSSFRLYDGRISSAITLTAQVISKWQAYNANKFIDEVFS